MTTIEMRPTRAESWAGEFPSLPGAHCAIRVNGERLYDPDQWFPPTGGANALVTQDAKAICESGCPVREECLAWALEHDEKGVWGGHTERERERIKAGLPPVLMLTCRDCAGEFPDPEVGRPGPRSKRCQECRGAA